MIIVYCLLFIDYLYKVMGLHAVKILGIKVIIDSKKDILEYIKKSLDKPLTIVTPNPEQLVLAQTNTAFRSILDQADIAIPDGIGVARLLRVERIPGVELMEDLIALAVKKCIGVALIGGRGNVAVEALECLSRRTPGLKGWGMEPESNSIKEIADKIRKTHVGMVFIGLGAPKQEFFIEKLNAHCIVMSVGGSFDIITGRTPRAPGFMRAFGLEWFWRLSQEPWRLKRQLALVKFVWLVFIERYINI